MLNFPHPINCCRHNTRSIPAGRGELPTSNLGNGATRSIGEPSYCCCFKESLWQCQREWQRQRESVRKAKAEEHRSTWWWQKMKKIQGGDGWRKKATHSYVELSYKKKNLWQKPCQNSTSGTCVCGDMRHFCSIDTSRPYSSDSGRVAFSPVLGVGTGSDNFFRFRN